MAFALRVRAIRRPPWKMGWETEPATSQVRNRWSSRSLNSPALLPGPPRMEKLGSRLFPLALRSSPLASIFILAARKSGLRARVSTGVGGLGGRERSGRGRLSLRSLPVDGYSPKSRESARRLASWERLPLARLARALARIEVAKSFSRRLGCSPRSKRSLT